MDKKAYGTTADGKSVDQYTLINSSGASVEIINYGGIITRLFVPDKNKKLGDVVLGFDNLQSYENNSPYFGAIIGRVANRIARGTYSVDGKEYHVPVNNGVNSLHGGLKGYDKRIWAAEDVSGKDGPALKLTLIDPDGSEGFPGTLNVTVIYTLTNQNTLRIEYAATTDKATPINLTNHTYWNLKDAGRSSIHDTLLKTYANAFTPTDAHLIPTGEIMPVKGTPIDFTSAKPMGQDIKTVGADPSGYDHNLVLQHHDGKLAKGLEVYEPVSGRVMEVWTTEPAIQFYTGNFLTGEFKGKDGIAYAKQSAFAFEAQYFPDSVNHPEFPDSILRPADTYHQLTEYRFSTAATTPF